MGTWQRPTSESDWLRLASRGAELGDCRPWGIEGAWGYGRGLAQHLVSADETGYEINARWTLYTVAVPTSLARPNSLMPTPSLFSSVRSLEICHASCLKTRLRSSSC